MTYILPNTSKDGTLTGFSRYYDGSHESFVPLNKRVIYQCFSFCIPNIQSEDDPAMYDMIKDIIPELSDVGITDIWWPPPYKALSLNVYQEGYAVMDRYDVGEFAQGKFTRTKYGTKAQLENVLSYSHEWGIRNMCDIVPNQMYMSDLAVCPGIYYSSAIGTGGHAWYGTIGTGAGQTSSDAPIFPLFVQYTEGGGQGQEKYGSFPYWYYYYFNGIGDTNNQGGTGEGTGPYIVMRDESYQPYRFYGYGDSRNHLPDWLQEAYNENNSITIQSSNTYLLVSQGWVNYVHFVPYLTYYKDQLSYEQTSETIWNVNNVAYFADTINYTTANKSFSRGFNYNQKISFIQYLINNNTSGTFTSSTTEDEVINWITQYVGSAVGEAMGNYIADETVAPGYGTGYSGMPGSWIVYNTNSDTSTWTTKFTYDLSNDSTMGGGEFLLGTDVNNVNSDVQKDTVNWQEFLLDLGYDGFRFDASQWYSQTILRNSAVLMSNKFSDDIINHLSVLEAYDGSGINDGGQGYEQIINFGQLEYDTGNYYSFWNCLFLGYGGGTLLNTFQSFGGANSSSAPSDMNYRMLPSGPYAGGQFRGGNSGQALNWSFVTNHDQEKTMMANFAVDNGGASGSEDELKSWANQWTWDRRKSVKVHAPYNVVSAYAYILLNDFTVPTVYYGDLFDSQEEYMSVKSPYYAAIMMILRLRKRYCAGQQFNEFYIANGSSGGATVNSGTSSGPARDNVNIDAVAQIRFGDDRDTGMVHVMSLGENLSYTITVPFGPYHANQTVKNVFAVGEEYAQTDKDGNFDVFITPQNTVLFQGYFSLWIPI